KIGRLALIDGDWSFPQLSTCQAFLLQLARFQRLRNACEFSGVAILKKRVKVQAKAQPKVAPFAFVPRSGRKRLERAAHIRRLKCPIPRLYAPTSRPMESAAARPPHPERMFAIPTPPSRQRPSKP